MLRARETSVSYFQINLHPFGCSPHLGIVVARFLHDLVDYGVGVLRVVVKQHQFLGAALHDDVDGFAPVAVSPATAARFVFLGKILCVVDENVRAFGQLAHGLVENGVAGFVVGSVDEDSIFGFEAEAHASLGMVEPCGLQLNPVFHRDTSGLDVGEVALRLHLADVHGKVGCGHLIGKDLLEAAHPARTLKEEPVLRVGVQRTEERHALDVVPMKVGNEDVGGKRPVAEFTLQLLAEHAESGAAIEDINAVAEAHFDAGGVASITHVLGLWRWRGTAHAPELDPHRFVNRTRARLPGLFLLGIFRRRTARVNCRVGSQATISRSAPR